MQKEIKLQFTADEINVILEGLGNLPFIKVYQLIGKIQEQASLQVQDDHGEAPAADRATERQTAK
jgi:hypothetical protein